MFWKYSNFCMSVLLFLCGVVSLQRCSILHPASGGFRGGAQGTWDSLLMEFLQKIYKGPFKRMQHVGTISSNIVGHNMSPFKHNVGTCWAVLVRVGRCWMKFDFSQPFHPTFFFEHAHLWPFTGTQSLRVRQSESIVIPEGTAFV